MSAYKAAFAQANNSLRHTERERATGERERQIVRKRGEESGELRERAQLCAYLSCHNNCLNA